MTPSKQMITSRSWRPLSKLFMTKHAGRVVSVTRESRCVKCAWTTEWATQRPSKSGYAQTKGSQRPWARSTTRGKRTRQFALDRSGMIVLGGSHPIGPRHQAPGDGRIGSQPRVSGQELREPGASGQVQFVFLVLSIAPVARPTFLATLCRFFTCGMHVQSLCLRQKFALHLQLCPVADIHPLPAAAMQLPFRYLLRSLS